MAERGDIVTCTQLQTGHPWNFTNTATRIRALLTSSLAGAVGLDWDGVDLVASSSSLTITGGVVTITSLSPVRVHVPVLDKTDAGLATVTDAATVRIDGAPSIAGGANVAITNAWALNVVAGNVNMAGKVYVGATGTTALLDNSALVVDGTTTIASAAGVFWRALHVPTCTLTITGANPVTLITHVRLGAARISTAATVATASTFCINGAPVISGGGGAITNRWASFISAGDSATRGRMQLATTLLSASFTSVANRLYIDPTYQTLTCATAANWDALYVHSGILYVTGNTGSPITRLSASTFMAPQIVKSDLTNAVVTDAATVYISGAPSDSPPEMVATNKWALLIPAGNVKVGGTLYFYETGGAILSIGAIPDTYFLKRSGTTVIGTNSIPAGFITGLTPAQVLFGGAGGGIDQDATFAWNTTNATLELGSPTSAAASTFILKGDKTVATAPGAVWSAFKLDNSTLSLTGNTGVTLLNFARINRPTLQGDTATATVTNASTLYIENAPVVGGTGNVSITNPWSLNVAAGATNLVGQTYVGAAGTALLLDNSALVVDGTKTVASAGAATWRALHVADATLTLSGAVATTLITFARIGTPSISTAATITDAASFYLTAPPSISAGGGAITNPWALYIASGDATSMARVLLHFSPAASRFSSLANRLVVCPTYATLTAAANSVWRGLEVSDGTLRVSGTTTITALNMVYVGLPVINGVTGPSLTVTSASAVNISNIPTANSNTVLTNSYALSITPTAVASTNTITTAASLYISAAPSVTGGAITTAWSILVAAGDSASVGRVQLAATPASGTFSSLANRLQIVPTYSSVAAAAGTKWRALEVTVGTLNLSGAGNVTTTALNTTYFDTPTITADAATKTITDACTVCIASAPVAGANTAITNAWALQVAAGNVKIGGTLYFYETGGATLSIANIPDGKFLKRSGTTVIGDDPTGASAIDAIMNDFLLMGG